MNFRTKSRRAETAAVVVVSIVAYCWSAAAAEYELDMTSEYSDYATVYLKLMFSDTIPSGQPIRGVLCAEEYHQNDDLVLQPQYKWIAFAEERNLALLYHDINRGSDPLDTTDQGAAIILEALRRFATAASRPEIEHAGLVFTGLSWSSRQCAVYTRAIPERTIASVPFRATGGDANVASQNSPENKVPLLVVEAGQETFNGYLTDDVDGTLDARVASGSLVTLCVQKNEQHHLMGNDQNFILTWLTTVVDMRVPTTIPVGQPYDLNPLDESQSWGGDYTVMADQRHIENATVTADDYTQHRLWFPNQYVADAWAHYVNTGDDAGIAVPPPGGSSGTVNRAPTAHNSTLFVRADDTLDVVLSYVDADGPGPYSLTILQQPSHGTLSGSGGSYVYTPEASYTGTDTILWTVSDGWLDSNEATVTITVQANQPPVAYDGQAQTVQGVEIALTLAYSDPDAGPGPTTVTILSDPAGGTLSSSGGACLYTPDSGFTGTDSFTWKVTDGEDDSNVATFTVEVHDDSDGDSLPDWWELLYGLDPYNEDSDGDGILDVDEDEDDDTYTNAAEFARGSDPLAAETSSGGDSGVSCSSGSAGFPQASLILLLLVVVARLRSRTLVNEGAPTNA